MTVVIDTTPRTYDSPSSPTTPSSPVVFSRFRNLSRSPSPQSSIVLDISAPAPADESRTVVEEEAEEDEDRKLGESTAPKLPSAPAASSDVEHPGGRNPGMRILGINYFPPVQEEESPVEGEKDVAHPLRLEVAPPSPTPWVNKDEDSDGERDGGWMHAVHSVSLTKQQEMCVFSCYIALPLSAS